MTKAITLISMTSAHLFAKIRQWFRPKPQWLSLTCPAGEREFIFVGSIHMGVPAMAPLPSGLRKVLRECQALVVEADITQGQPPEIESSAQGPTLQQQLTTEQWQQFEVACQECHLDTQMLAQFPAWQVGLTLQQKQATMLGLRPEFGVDHQLLSLAHLAHQPVIALESQQQQLQLLTTLPNRGLDLLLDSLTHWRSNARQLQKMIDWWLSKNHPSSSSLPELSRSFSHDLQQTFITQRNKLWARHLLTLPPGRYLVAVGALHLSGPDNLIDLITSPAQKEPL
ncbi:TraB/GumN family protein [Rosenbergiella nectarea]